MIFIGLVDDHVITRKGLRNLIEVTNKYQVIVEASNGKELLYSLSAMEILPDLIILDLSMPEMDGFETIDQISKKYPSIKILIFTFYNAEDVILNAIHRGASGYLPKKADPDILLKAIQAIMKYGFYLNDLGKKQYLMKKLPGKNLKGFHGKQVLTDKEIQFIRLASSNLTYKEIALQLNVQPKTLENYRDSVFQKLGINNRAALTLYGIQNGIVHLF